MECSKLLVWVMCQLRFWNCGPNCLVGRRLRPDSSATREHTGIHDNRFMVFYESLYRSESSPRHDISVVVSISTKSLLAIARADVNCILFHFCRYEAGRSNRPLHSSGDGVTGDADGARWCNRDVQHPSRSQQKSGYGCCYGAAHELKFRLCQGPAF